MFTLYNVVSADGFIARKDGSEDFIPDSYWPSTLAVLAKYDCIVLGRNTYETIQKYDENLRTSFEALPVKKIVISDNKEFHPKEGYTVLDSPEDALQEGKEVLVTSGPILNTYLLEKKLVKQILFHIVPVTLGEGIKPYREVSNEVEVRELPL